MLDMRRRQFIMLLGGAAAGWPLAANAQQAGGMPRIGVLIGDAETGPYGSEIAAFQNEMKRLGWNDGQNIRIEYRFPILNPKGVEAVAAELIASAPDVIVSNYNAVTTAVRSTHTIPTVFVGVSDPVGSAFVTDLARPTGNLTGFANFVPSMGGKWLEKLREIAPRVERVGFMLHPETPPNVAF